MELRITENKKLVPIMVRLAPELHEALRQVAFDERRSINAQVQILLERGLECVSKTHRPDPLPAN